MLDSVGEKSALQGQAPNIILIMADQMSTFISDYYQGLSSLTPHLDRMAENGVRFSRFYCNSPICCASRASFFSGRYPSEVEVYDNGAEFSASIPTFLHGLKSVGYRTFLSGKAHFVGPDQSHGFDDRLTCDIYPASFAWTPDWTKPVALNHGSNISALKDSGECQWSMQLEYDDEVLHQGLRLIRSEAKRQSEEGAASAPFFLNVNFTHPHDPFHMPRAYLDRVDPSAILPPRQEWGIHTDHPYNEWINHHHGHEHFTLSDAEIQASRQAYLAACAYIDDCVGTLRAEVDRMGLRDHTLVLFTSDHGEMLGEHGMWFKRTFFEESIRIPFIATGPGLSIGDTVSATASLVDLFPTLCELGGVDPSFAQTCNARGSSLVSLMTPAATTSCSPSTPSEQRHAIVEYLGEGTVEPLRAVVADDGLKLVSVRTLPKVLIDLAGDPHELANLWDQNHTKPEVQELLQLLVGPDDWDENAVHDRIVESQQQRFTLFAGASTQPPSVWDWSPRSPQGPVVKVNAQQEAAWHRYPRIVHIPKRTDDKTTP